MKSIFMKKISDISLLDMAAEYVLSTGIIRESNDDIKVAQIDNLEIRLKAIHVSRSTGTFSIYWSDIDSQTIEMYISGEKIVDATRILGGFEGYAGMFGSQKKVVEPTDWTVKQFNSLEKIKQYINDISKELI